MTKIETNYFKAEFVEFRYRNFASGIRVKGYFVQINTFLYVVSIETTSNNSMYIVICYDEIKWDS